MIIVAGFNKPEILSFFKNTNQDCVFIDIGNINDSTFDLSALVHKEVTSIMINDDPQFNDKIIKAICNTNLNFSLLKYNRESENLKKLIEYECSRLKKQNNKLKVPFDIVAYKKIKDNLAKDVYIQLPTRCIKLFNKGEPIDLYDLKRRRFSIDKLFVFSDFKKYKINIILGEGEITNWSNTRMINRSQFF